MNHQNVTEQAPYMFTANLHDSPLLNKCTALLDIANTTQQITYLGALGGG